jgi:hypothetical protein
MLEFDPRRFTDSVDVHTPIKLVHRNTTPLQVIVTSMTYYEVGKLAFNLLPILLSRIKALGSSWQAHEVTVLLQNHPAFHLIKSDPLEFQKVKAMQAIEEFLKV